VPFFERLYLTDSFCFFHRFSVIVAQPLSFSLYRKNKMTTEVKAVTDEEKNWVRRIRKRRFISFILFFAYVPSVGIIHQLTGSDKLSIGIALLFMLSIGSLWVSLNFAKCPKCHNNFFWTWFWVNGFTNKCLHCGLSLKE